MAQRPPQVSDRLAAEVARGPGDAAVVTVKVQRSRTAAVILQEVDVVATWDMWKAGMWMGKAAVHCTIPYPGQREEHTEELR